jgi:hypothetical protein
LDTALYYTFSTIAQTLAAAMALLAGFALYRLQGLSKVLEDTSLTILEAYVGADHGRLNALRVGAQFADFRDNYRTMTPIHAVTAEPYAARRRTFEDALTTVARVRKYLNSALLLTVFVILAAVSILANTPALASSQYAGLTLGLGTVATAACLVMYGALVRVTLPRTA